MNLMKIRLLTRDTILEYKDAVTKFIYESVTMSDYEDSYGIQDARKKHSELEEYLNDNKAIVLGAIAENELVGLLWAYTYPFREDINRLYVSVLHVREDYRGRHIGSQLLETIERIAKEKHYDAIYLHAEAANSGACRFYKRQQYISERIQYVKQIVPPNIASSNKFEGRIVTSDYLMSHYSQFVSLYLENIRAHKFTSGSTRRDAEEKIIALKRYLDSGRAYAYMTEKNRQITGFMWVHPYIYHGRSRLYMHSITVGKDFRNQGIGWALYQTAFCLLPAGEIIYTHVDTGNIASQKLHKKIGFKEEMFQYVKQCNQS